MRQVEGKHSASSTFTIPQSNTLFNFLILVWGGMRAGFGIALFSKSPEFRFRFAKYATRKFRKEIDVE